MTTTHEDIRAALERVGNQIAELQLYEVRLWALQVNLHDEQKHKKGTT